MGKLIYSANMSLDGYIEDASGSFDWSVPDEELHQFFNDLLRGIGTHLLGRRMYETMSVWETDPTLAEGSAVMADFAAVWQDADKVVYSTSLAEPTPVAVGAGKPAFPTDVRLDLELVDQRRFANGAVHLAYRMRT